MHIYITSDHAGFALKGVLKPFLEEEGYQVHDCGPSTLDEHDDYPDYMQELAQCVAREKGSMGIGIGASGQGEAISANRVSGVRAVVYYGAPSREQTDTAGAILNLVQSTRAHNDANILCLGARFISDDDAKEAVRLWLSTPFSGDERHMRRIAKIDA